MTEKIDTTVEEKDNTERRRESREKVLKSAKIIFGDGNTDVTCEVRDVSKEGARLKCEAPHEWPVNVSLSIEGAAPVECEVVWSLNTLLGIKFIG